MNIFTSQLFIYFILHFTASEIRRCSVGKHCVQLKLNQLKEYYEWA